MTFGGAGVDIFTGGGAKDRYRMGANEGNDTITDFNQPESDTIEFFDASGVESLADLTFTQQGAEYARHICRGYNCIGRLCINRS